MSITRIGDHQLVRQLGEGPQARVHAVTPPSRLGLADAEIALKVFKPYVDDAGFDRATEILVAHAGARSPYLLDVLDVGLHDATLFVATRLAEGSLESGAAPAEAVAAVARAARGAHALHEVGVVHGGIKPSNLLRTADGVVLSEPALAGEIAPGQTVAGAGDQGGIAYFDPSVLMGSPKGRASDVWSLGVTLHQLLTGASLHPRMDAANTMGAMRVLVEDAPVIDGSLPAPLKPIVQACVGDRAMRPSTAEALADLLDAVDGL